MSVEKPHRAPAMGREQIEACIPHRSPMLLIDQVLEIEDERIVCTKTFDAGEFFFQGHYPNAPIVPGVVLCEACMQAGAILLSEKMRQESSGESATVSDTDQVPVATRINDVRLKKMITPGDTIEMEVTLSEQLANAFFMKAKATSGGKVAVRFEFACALAPKP